MKKTISTLIKSLERDGPERFKGGFGGIRGGGALVLVYDNAAHTCTNNGTCLSNNEKCTNGGNCSDSTNTSCSNTHTCFA